MLNRKLPKSKSWPSFRLSYRGLRVRCCSYIGIRTREGVTSVNKGATKVVDWW